MIQSNKVCNYSCPCFYRFVTPFWSKTVFPHLFILITLLFSLSHSFSVRKTNQTAWKRQFLLFSSVHRCLIWLASWSPWAALCGCGFWKTKIHPTQFVLSPKNCAARGMCFFSRNSGRKGSLKTAFLLSPKSHLAVWLDVPLPPSTSLRGAVHFFIQTP